jgi:hypothetical protein
MRVARRTVREVYLFIAMKWNKIRATERTDRLECHVVPDGRRAWPDGGKKNGRRSARFPCIAMDRDQ